MEDTSNLLTQNRRLAEDLKRRIDQLAAIGTVATAVSQSLDLSRTLHIALQAVLEILEAEAGGISLIDESAGEVVLRAQQGWTYDFVSTPMRIPLGKGLSGQVVANDEVLVINDLDAPIELAVPSFRYERFRSIVMAPMHARGTIIGILSIMSSKPYNFDDDMIKVLCAIADTVGVALDNARLYETSVENENRLSAVLHSTADGILATDQTGRIRLVNPTAENMLGVHADTLIGMPLREAPISENVRNSLLFALSSRVDDSNFQVTLADERILSVLVSPVYVESQVEQNEETDGWVIVLQDVTHFRQAELARTRFIQAAAHDMRNPLNATLSSLYMLENLVGGSDQTVGEVIDIAMIGVRRIQSLIDDLLNLEHIQSGYGFQLSEVHIGDLIDEASIEIKSCLDEKALVYQVDVQRGLPLMQLDKRWVLRAILNYLDNAYKYAPNSGSVTLRVFANAPFLHIEVSDDGPGIPIEAQARLFERFYRVYDVDEIPGTGLGLAIVKSVAEAHGGGVYVRSKPGQGSTFGMTLRMSFND